MIPHLSGTTRLHVIIGDPIAQVKSPGGITKAFAALGHDAVLVPVQVGVEDLEDFLGVAARLKNLDSIVVTIPHKFACINYCVSTTERARFIGAVNIMRRRNGGGWHGDMIDGFGFLSAVLAKGFKPSGQRVLQIGAGGAGSAIAFAFINAGVRELVLHDTDTDRRDALIGRLNACAPGVARAGSSDPTGFDLIANASPAGMKPKDPFPVDVTKLTQRMFVACVITEPAVPPLLAAAQVLGCTTSNGIEMYQAAQSAMLDFMLATD
jgi:shikimate dehydrogenase